MRLFHLLLVSAAFSLPAAAQDQFTNVEIKTEPVSGNVYVLYGAGGNIGVLKGEDGILMVDNQYAPLAARIKAALAALGSDVPAYVLNTHYHGDHTGGNPYFGKDSIIVAHDNVRVRLLNADDFPAQGLPAITYSDQASLHFNGEDVRLIHMPEGHTDGDTIVFFQGSKVVHMGDHFFRDRFPYVDLQAGGSVQGLLGNIKLALELIPDDVPIIPGHGPLADKSDLVRYYNMLIETTGMVNRALADGKSADQIVDTGLEEKWDSWGAGFINEERWIRTIVASYND
ncbi:MAG: MBL fold metallo-hydrolase [Pseudomonadales bacterium]